MLTANCYNTLQNLFSERQPYTIEIRNSVEYIIFTDKFLELLDDFLENGEMKDMCTDEYDMVMRLVAYEDDTSLNVDDAKALDRLLVNYINSIEPIQNINRTIG